MLLLFNYNCNTKTSGIIVVKTQQAHPPKRLCHDHDNSSHRKGGRGGDSHPPRLFDHVCLLKQTGSLGGKNVHRVFGGRRNLIETKHAFHIWAERRTNLIMWNKSVVCQRGKKANVCFFRSVNSGRRFSLETGSRPALCGLESDQSSFRLLHPQALRAAEQCNDRFWPSVEERIIKTSCFHSHVLNLDGFYRAYFIDYGFFLCVLQ